jgi:hypothetical protein
MINKQRAKLFLMMLFIFGLTACNSPKKTILGRWELVSLKTNAYIGAGGFVEQLVWANAGGPVDLEFYEDGTINVYTLTGITTGEYNWTDDSHIKVSTASVSTVYEFQFNNDELILKDDVTEHQSVFKQYQEYPINTETLNGTWLSHMFLTDESNCFQNDDMTGSPERITFGKDGSFTASGSVSLVEAVSLSGNYAIDNDFVNATSSGILTNSLGTLNIYQSQGYDRWGRKEVQSNISCRVKQLTNSRLVFVDDQGKISIYVLPEYLELLATAFGDENDADDDTPKINSEEWRLISTAYTESESSNGKQTIDFELAVENHTSTWGYVTFSVDDPRALLTTSEDKYYIIDSCELQSYGKVQIPPGFVRDIGSLSCTLDTKSDAYEASVILYIEKRNMIHSMGLVYESLDEILAEGVVKITLGNTKTPSYPFVNSGGWEAYKTTPPPRTIVLDPGQSWNTSFGSIVFDELIRSTDSSSNTLRVLILNQDEQSDMRIYLHSTHAFHTDGNVHNLDDPYQLVPPKETTMLEITYPDNEEKVTAGLVCFTVYEIPYHLWDSEDSEYTESSFIVCFP